nr:MAG TPA: hypothetical protein [Caudoviricetes sp.]
MTKAHLFLTRAKNLKKNGAENRNFGQFSGHLPGFCPLLKPNFDHEKPSIYAGLRAFCPLSHFFL